MSAACNVICEPEAMDSNPGVPRAVRVQALGLKRWRGGGAGGGLVSTD